MTPEEAQRMTEEKWKAIAGDNEGLCGWCEFSIALESADSPCCSCCPVPRVHHGKLCVDLPVLDEFFSLDRPDNAQAVYEFLCQMGPQYIAAAHEILLEEKEHEA